jgi:hypothetical protein
MARAGPPIKPAETLTFSTHITNALTHRSFTILPPPHQGTVFFTMHLKRNSDCISAHSLKAPPQFTRPPGSGADTITELTAVPASSTTTLEAIPQTTGAVTETSSGTTRTLLTAQNLARLQEGYTPSAMAPSQTPLSAGRSNSAVNVEEQRIRLSRANIYFNDKSAPIPSALQGHIKMLRSPRKAPSPKAKKIADNAHQARLGNEITAIS